MPSIRHAVVLAVALFAAASPALAQSPPPPASPAAPATPASQAYSIDTPVEALVAEPMAKAVLDADIPGLTSHPMYDRFKGENLRVLAPKFGGAISDKDLAKLQTDLAALPSSKLSN